MKKFNSKGFSAIEGLLIALVLALIGGVGYFVWHARSQNTNLPTTNTINTNSNIYNFKELGISMELLPGWAVKANTNVDNGVKSYNWSVEKTGDTGGISLLSTAFSGGFEPLCNPNLTKVVDIADTKNNNLKFIYWSGTFQTEGSASAKTLDSIVIAKADEKDFSSSYSNDSLVGEVKNSELKTGDYYYCSSGPTPGFSLDLNKETSTGTARLDRIYAGINRAPIDSDGDLTSTQSYKDIKTMLTSIK